MSVITLTVDEARRALSASDTNAFVINDKNVDVVRFALLTGFADIALDEHSALRVMYQRPGETEVRAQTLTYYDTDGIHNFYDWELLSADLAEKGTLTVALCILRTDGDVEEWHTTPCQVRVLGSIHTDDSDEGDETITPTVAQRVAVLETMIQRVASGAPVVVSSVSEMTDTEQIYVLSTDGEWYYYDGSAWTAGGEYGAVSTDRTLSMEGIPADAKAVGDEIADLKEDLSGTQKFSRTITPIGQNKTVELTAGTSILNFQKIINLSVKTGTIYYVRVDDPNGAIDSGNNVNIYYYGTSGGATHIAAIATNTLYHFKAPTDITAFALYISGAKIVESENIHLNVYYNEFNYSSLEQKIEDYHMYQLEQVASDNLFTSWEIGGLNITDGMPIFNVNRLVSKGFIPVIGGQVYTINDPDKISDQARNAQFVYEYDVNHDLIQTQTITNNETITLSANTKYIKLLSQSVGTQSYTIGDYTNFKTMVFKGADYMPYISNHAVASGIGVENTSYKMSSGSISSNAFSGKAFLCGSLNYSTGKVGAGNTIIATPLIPISGKMFYQMFDGKVGDVQYIFEYDSNGVFVKYTSVGTNYNGNITLDANTRFIRIRTQTSGVQSYVLPDIKWYDEHLVVSNEPINRYQNYLPVVTQDNVSNNFYDTAVSFKTIGDIKPDIDAYAKTILETGYDVVIPIITDIHSTLSEPYDIHNYIAGKGIADVAFNLGDNIPNYYETRQEAIDMLENVFHEEFLQPRKCEVYALCGNHDYNPYGSNAKAYTINQRAFYSISQARTKKGYAGSGKNYGYIDLAPAKIRIIWLDSGDIFDNTTGDPLTTGNNTIVQQEQFTWFCNVALNFMDKPDRAEWAVVTLSHDKLSSLSDGGFATVIKAFVNGTAAQGTAYCVGRGSTIPQEYDVDFTTQGAIEYICHLNGHYHEDNIIDLGDTGRKQISIACDNRTAYHYVDGEKVEYTRTPGTIEMHCIDTFCLDRKHKTITMKRLGVGSDRTITY